MRGTLLNTATVAAGASLGLLIGKVIPHSYEVLVISTAGLITLGLGIKMFLGHKNLLAVAAAVMIGGCLGLLFGIDRGVNAFAEWAKVSLGGGGTFVEGLVTTSVLYCVGPMTLMGCIQDGLDGKSELLQLKALLDGMVGIFFAAALGPGVLVSAVVVLVVQGTLTVLARQLKTFAQDEDMVADAVAAGGILMMGISLGLLDLKRIGVPNLLPALFLAPFFVATSRRKWIRLGKV
jgi:uncharacterized protein